MDQQQKKPYRNDIQLFNVLPSYPDYQSPQYLSYFSFSYLSQPCVTIFLMQKIELHFLSPLHPTFHNVHKRKYICGNEVIKWLFSNTRRIKRVQVAWVAELRGELKRRVNPKKRTECLKDTLHIVVNEQFYVWYFYIMVARTTVKWEEQKRQSLKDLILMLYLYSVSFLCINGIKIYLLRLITLRDLKHIKHYQNVCLVGFNKSQRTPSLNA